jgi:hypothetical protein
MRVMMTAARNSLAGFGTDQQAGLASAEPEAMANTAAGAITAGMSIMKDECPTGAASLRAERRSANRDRQLHVSHNAVCSRRHYESPRNAAAYTVASDGAISIRFGGEAG